MVRASLFAIAVCAVGSQAAGAASLDVPTRVACTVDDAVALTDVVGYSGDSKANQLGSWIGSLVLADPRTSGLTLDFDWSPWTSDGPKLRIISNDTTHNLVRILSRTKDSLIAVSSASDRLTSESWLFTLNFRHEAVIATRVQTNIAGVKGQVLQLACRFDGATPSADEPELPDDLG